MDVRGIVFHETSFACFLGQIFVDRGTKIIAAQVGRRSQKQDCALYVSDGIKTTIHC